MAGGGRPPIALPHHSPQFLPFLPDHHENREARTAKTAFFQIRSDIQGGGVGGRASLISSANNIYGGPVSP